MGEATTSLYTRYATRYIKTDTKTASGKRKSFDCGDAIAVAFRGKPQEFLIEVCKENFIDAKPWKNLNPGRFRMQVGRALRNVFKRDGVILIAGKKVREL